MGVPVLVLSRIWVLMVWGVAAWVGRVKNNDNKKTSTIRKVLSKNFEIFPISGVETTPSF